MAERTLAECLEQVEAARRQAAELLAKGMHDAVQQQFLSRKGAFKQLQSLLGQLSADDRPAFGKIFHEAKTYVEQAVADIATPTKPTAKSGPSFDFLPPLKPTVGTRHPLMQTIEEIVDIFARMGFAHAEGPEVEDTFHNFIALNIPDDHPARDPRDNFYIDNGLLLRSQTSTVQIRVMENQPPPIRVISIGRVYRPDTADATHSPMFHQVEGLLVDEGITLAHLKTVLKMFTQTYLGSGVKIRFRPSFFPFTEPSIEVDMTRDDSGKWIELGGAGMVDPNVFAAVGYDPEKVSGFAFGLGIERLAMRRYGIDDMRLLFDNDVRFLRQFT